MMKNTKVNSIGISKAKKMKTTRKTTYDNHGAKMTMNLRNNLLQST